jgi:hypothetical protein
LPADTIVGHRDWNAFLNSLLGADRANVDREVAKLSHEELISMATSLYSTPRAPGAQTLALRQALQDKDSEALRIGILNANYESAYRSQNWHDIVMYLNAYSADDIEKRVARWNKGELQEGLHQAQLQFGAAGTARMGPLILKRLPPPPVGPGTGPQLVSLGEEALKGAAILLKGSAPCKVNGGVSGDVLIHPGAAIGDKMLVSATPTGVYYTEGPGLYQMYAPDFVREMWLNGFSEGAKRAEGMVYLAKLEFQIILAVFVPWYGVAGLSLLQAIVTLDENRDSVAKLRAALPKFIAARAAFKERYPALYDKFFWHCFWEVLKHMPEGVEFEDVAYFLGRVAGTQGLMGAFSKALKEATKVTAKTVAKIVLEYAVLVSILHAPGIIGRAAKIAGEKAADEVKRSLAEVGIDVNSEEAKLIAKELAGGKDPSDVLNGIRDSSRDIADAIEKIEAYSKKHNF